jgi:hypoxanthine phosphoribosyltransferase
MPKTNDTKYTLEFVLKEVESLLSQLKEDKDIIYIGELFEDKDYTRQRYNEWLTPPNNDKNDRVTRH